MSVISLMVLCLYVEYKSNCNMFLFLFFICQFVLPELYHKDNDVQLMV